VDDRDVLDHISQLVEEEKALRSHAPVGHPIGAAERERIAELEVLLDQYWDLLRRRQGREEFGLDPDLETTRAPEVVEKYRQ
jgi:hypothetical protein